MTTETPITVSLRRCITHRTRTGHVRLCCGHEGELEAHSEGADKPAWYDALGLAEYLGVHRGYGHRDLCDACRHEALAAHGLLGKEIEEQPWDMGGDHVLTVQLLPAF